MRRFTLLVPCLIVLLLAASGAAAFAQDRSVVVRERSADVTIQSNGDARVVETWVVDFQGGPFRRAFLGLPTERFSDVTIQGVSEDGRAYTLATSDQPGTYTVETSGNERTVTWFFEPATNATRTFQIEYTLGEALRIYDEGDQFWWEFIEPGRGYPIASAQVTLHLPARFDPSELVATSYRDRADVFGATIADGQTIRFDGKTFGPDTVWEIRAGFPHGAVTQPVQAWQVAEDRQDARAQAAAAAQQQFTFYSLLTALLILLGGGLGLLLLWYLRGRDAAVGLAAEFLNAPPDALTPALAGTLVDEEANVRDVLATLIDWAQRGIIRIREMPQGSGGASAGYVYERLTDNPPLQYSYERELMQRLWQGETSRSLDDIRRRFGDALDEIFDSIYEELVRDGNFPARPDRERARFARYGWLLLILICPTAFLFQFAAQSLFNLAVSFAWAALAPWAALAVVSLALLWLSRFMPRKTRAGALAAAKWNAFRRYLEQIDRYTNVRDAQAQFEKYLPYAVAFGIDKTWVEKFAAVGAPAPTWYVPSPAVWASSTSKLPRETGTSRAWDMLGGTGGDGASGGWGEARGDAKPSGGSAPSLESAASGALSSLNSVSAGIFSMLNDTAESFVTSNPSANPSSRSFRTGAQSSFFSGGSRSRASSFRSSPHRSSGGRASGGGRRSGFG